MSLPRFSNVKKLKYPGFTILHLFKSLVDVDDGHGSGIYYFIYIPVLVILTVIPVIPIVMACVETINLLAYPLAFILDLLNFIPSLNLELYRMPKYGDWNHQTKTHDVIDPGYANFPAIIIYVIFLFFIDYMFRPLELFNLQLGGRRRR